MSIVIPDLTQQEMNNFWAKVKRPKTGCWHWQKGLTPGGYGKLGIRGVTLTAHRVAYKLQYGEDPGDLLVCHKCDKRTCQRGDHLFLGTSDDNQKDMAAKRRSPSGAKHWSRREPEKVARGSKQGSSVLMAEQVIEARRKYDAKEASSYQLAKELGMSQGSCWRMLIRKSWKHIE